MKLGETVTYPSLGGMASCGGVPMRFACAQWLWSASCWSQASERRLFSPGWAGSHHSGGLELEQLQSELGLLCSRGSLHPIRGGGGLRGWNEVYWGKWVSDRRPCLGMGRRPGLRTRGWTSVLVSLPPQPLACMPLLRGRVRLERAPALTGPVSLLQMRRRDTQACDGRSHPRASFTPPSVCKVGLPSDNILRLGYTDTQAGNVCLHTGQSRGRVQAGRSPPSEHTLRSTPCSVGAARARGVEQEPWAGCGIHWDGPG